MLWIIDISGIFFDVDGVAKLYFSLIYCFWNILRSSRVRNWFEIQIFNILGGSYPIALTNNMLNFPEQHGKVSDKISNKTR